PPESVASTRSSSPQGHTTGGISTRGGGSAGSWLSRDLTTRIRVSSVWGSLPCSSFSQNEQTGHCRRFPAWRGRAKIFWPHGQASSNIPAGRSNPRGDSGEDSKVIVTALFVLGSMPQTTTKRSRQAAQVIGRPIERTSIDAALP